MDMENVFEKLLLQTSFACMACDGEIAHEEVATIKSFAEEKKVFGNLDIETELQMLTEEINKKGKVFLKQYLLMVADSSLSIEQECAVLQIALDTIKSDNDVRYSEVKFFKVLRSNLKNITDTEILKRVDGIDESYLAQDIKQSYIEMYDSYFDNIELSEVVIN